MVGVPRAEFRLVVSPVVLSRIASGGGGGGREEGGSLSLSLSLVRFGQEVKISNSHTSLAAKNGLKKVCD